MKTLTRCFLHLTILLLPGLAAAQDTPGAPPCGRGMAASGAAAACQDAPHMRQGMHGGVRKHMQPGSNNTSGWALMSAEERRAHRDKMFSFKSYDECKAYMDQHHAQMSERAKTAGRKTPALPRQDACRSLK